MRVLVARLIKRLIRQGSLLVVWPDGSQSRYVGEPGPAASFAFTDPAVLYRLIVNPSLAFGEGYMNGQIVPLECSIYQILDLITLNMAQGRAFSPLVRLGGRLVPYVGRLRQRNSAARARANATHHYDLKGRLYSLFLDRDRQYSCAYFPTGEETLEEAQEAKKRHIAAKLKLDRPGLSVLDIGSGWGGLGLFLAREHGAQVLGITLSSEQLAESRARAEALGLSDRVRFELADYRAISGSFDRIVSVGMFEHVGVPNYRAFFSMLRHSLKPDGVALLHTIGCSDGPASTDPWLAKYIFPGGYTPALSEIMRPIEKSGLVVADIEVLRLHYAETLKHWRRRFAANRDAISSLYDERFCRMFEFYLCGAELAFRHQHLVVFQIQIAREQTAVPLTRDYILEAERTIASAPAGIA